MKIVFGLFGLALGGIILVDLVTHPEGGTSRDIYGPAQAGGT